MFSPLQLGANALLFLSVNMYGVFVRLLAERSQRKAFLQARNCIEDRLRLEDENEKQVSAWGPAGGTRGDAGWGARGGTAFSHGPWVWGPTWPAWGRVGASGPAGPSAFVGHPASGQRWGRRWKKCRPLSSFGLDLPAGDLRNRAVEEASRQL